MKAITYFQNIKLPMLQYSDRQFPFYHDYIG